jgi:lipopolysaccharide export system permease protein
MNLLRRHMINAVLRGVALVLLIVVVIGVVVEFVGQFDDVGIANYGLAEAALYVALRIPRLVLQALPAAALLGALLGLGNLAVHRELVVMRTSGVSHLQMLTAVGLAGGLLMLCMLLLSESLAPSLGAYAREVRTQALLDEVSVATGQSAWLKDGDRIINLRRPGRGLDFTGGVQIYQLDGDTSLAQIARANSAGIEATNQWLLFDYTETSFDAGGTNTRRLPSVRLDYEVSPDLLQLSVVREDLLDTRALTRYIAYLRANGLDASRYLGAYWQRIASIVSLLFMTMLALPFVFGSLRSAGTGARMIVGVVIGLGYYVAVQLSSSTGQVFGFDPVLSAWAPTGVLILVTAVALSRVR